MRVSLVKRNSIKTQLKAFLEVTRSTTSMHNNPSLSLAISSIASRRTAENNIDFYIKLSIHENSSTLLTVFYLFLLLASFIVVLLAPF